MHDLKYIIENEKEVRRNIKKRKIDLHILEKIIEMDSERKGLIQLVEEKRFDLKELAKKIGPLKKSGGDASEFVNQVAGIKSKLEDEDKLLQEILGEQNFLLSSLPNLIADDVPEGKDEGENQEIKKWGTPREFDFAPKDHVNIAENLNIIDFEKASELAGARFVIYKNDLAKLERALINFFITFLTEKKGHQEILPPFIAHERSLFGTGQLPRFQEDLFKIEGHDWFLIPTAEVPLTNLKRDEIFSEEELPLKYCAYTPCFRSEAGSYGRDTRGLIRLHQFNKVEMVNIVSAQESCGAHQEMTDCAMELLEMLELPYRQVLLCSGDIGFSARKCFDLEVWLPAQNCYREISSISNCWDFQARRASIRYRNSKGRPEYAHTLNGSGLAVGRTVVAILENYQQSNGEVVIPRALRPYMGGQERMVKN